MQTSTSSYIVCIVHHVQLYVHVLASTIGTHVRRTNLQIISFFYISFSSMRIVWKPPGSRVFESNRFTRTVCEHILYVFTDPIPPRDAITIAMISFFHRASHTLVLHPPLKHFCALDLHTRTPKSSNHDTFSAYETRDANW